VGWGARGTPFGGVCQRAHQLRGPVGQRRQAHGGAGHLAGRTYLAINQAAPGFQDATDLLLDITGVTGTIDAGEFIT
jgi:hypothetical protein